MTRQVSTLVSAVAVISFWYHYSYIAFPPMETILGNSRPSQHYCLYQDDNIADGLCFNLLAPAVKQKPAWFFMGDSQMNYMVENIKYPYEITFSRLPDKEHPLWGRCNLLNYYFMERSETWTPPATMNGGRGKIQGPTEYGLGHNYCNDAMGLVNKQFSSSSLNFMEYLAIEFASDVEHQSTTTNTSQESGVHYMKKQLANLFLTKEDSVCVVNPGLHDQKLCPDLPSEEACFDVYTNNVKYYLKQLNTTCGHIIWLSITSVRGDENRPQLNSRMVLWNRMINETMAKEYPHNSFFVDVWNASHHYIRNGNVHFEQEYYIRLASLFSNLM